MSDRTQLLAAALATILAVALTALELPIPLIRALVGAPLILLLPGYALVRAVRPAGGLQPGEGLTAAVGLSLTLTILVGTLLHWSPWGVRALPAALILGGITLAGIAGALARAGAGAPGRALPPLRPSQQARLGLALAVGCGAILVAYLGAMQQPRPGFTQLWALPAPGVADTYELGMWSQEAAPVRFRLTVNQGEQILQQWEPITLRPGEAWRIAYTLSGAPTAEVRLYRIDEPQTPYRHVKIGITRP